MALFLYLSLILISNLVIWLIAVKKQFDVCAFYILGQLFLFVPAAVLIFFDLQANHTNPFLSYVNFEETLTLQGLIFAVHACGILLGYLLIRNTGLSRLIMPHFNDNRSDKMTFIGLAVLTLINMAVIAGPFLQSGSFFGAIYLIRNEYYFSGMNYLRIFIAVGTFLSAAHFAHILRHRKNRDYRLPAIAAAASLFIINLIFSSFLGGKGFIVYPFIFFLLALYARELYRRLGVIVMLGMVFVSAIVALQQIRVEIIHDNQQHGMWEYAYVGLRFQLFEDNMVYLGTHGDLHQTKTGEDFINGVLGPVPRSLWKGKPQDITAGGRFKRQLMPNATGGWPPYGFNQWYTNFGWFGVMMGGLLTGLFLRTLQGVYRDYQTNTYSFVIMMVFLVRLLINGGVHNLFFIEYVFYILPLFIFARLTDKRLYQTPDIACRSPVK